MVQAQAFRETAYKTFCHDRLASVHPASRAFSYGSYALYKALHESCQVLVEHAQRVAKIQFRTQAIHISRGYNRQVIRRHVFPWAQFRPSASRKS